MLKNFVIINSQGIPSKIILSTIRCSAPRKMLSKSTQLDFDD